VVDQLTRLRDGDRFYYERLPDSMRIQAKHTRLSTVIRRNTEATLTDTRHEMMRLARPAAGTLVGFESAQAWSATGGSIATNTDYSTDGNAAVDVADGTYVALTSGSTLPAATFAGAQHMLVDVFVPEDVPTTYWAGLLQAHLTCPGASLFDDFVGQAELTLMPRGQFNTAELPIGSSVRSRLSANPGASCTIKLVLVTNGMNTPYALDRLRAR
jgi:hypothetical protein